MLKIKGIHHISSIVSSPQRNVSFYTHVLGLRLVKKTLNYDDRNYYHLYYGNKDGSNGLITTFPMDNIVRGRIGDGQVGYVTYSVPINSIAFWKNRLDESKIKNYEYSRFNKKRLRFQDPDGLELELIENDLKSNKEWIYRNISREEAFSGIYSAGLYSKFPNLTLNLLRDIFGYKIDDEDENYYRLKMNNSQDQDFVELSKNKQGSGQVAVGTVHHIAFEIEDNEIDLWRELLLRKGLQVTEVKDRSYFKSLYFRDPGGILFELATTGPGLLIDESLEKLGETLIVPQHFQIFEDEIIANLPHLEVNKPHS